MKASLVINFLNGKSSMTLTNKSKELQSICNCMASLVPSVNLNIHLQGMYTCTLRLINLVVLISELIDKFAIPEEDACISLVVSANMNSVMAVVNRLKWARNVVCLTIALNWAYIHIILEIVYFIYVTKSQVNSKHFLG